MKKRYMNPYIAGTLLGMVLLLSMFLSGHGIGASGAMRNCTMSIVKAIDRIYSCKSLRGNSILPIYLLVNCELS
jgi:hypothetical protein